MNCWLLVPVALFSLVLVVPSSQGGLFRKRSCESDCGPAKCIVGYETRLQTVSVPEWVTEVKKVNVTEYRTFAEKGKVTKYKTEEIKEVKPYTFTTYERVKEMRTEEVYSVEQVTSPEKHTYTVYERVETPKTGTRKVSKPVTRTEKRTVTKDVGHCEIQCMEVACDSGCGRKGLFGRCCKRGCEDDCAPKTKMVSRKVWIPNLITTTEDVTFTTCEWVEEKYNYVEVSHKPVTKTETVNVTKCVTVKKPRTFEVWVCKPVTKTENRTYISYKTTPYTEEVTYNVCRPVTVEKAVTVRVCHYVTKTIEVKVPVYGVVECAAPATSCAPVKKGCCK